ncbi:MATE efflux family protein [Raphanus sativus]|nr:MATE efflux family protein [Raphanus sativus]
MGKDKTLPLLDPREPPELTETKPASRVWAKEFRQESKRLWELAGPAIFTAISQYSLGALTQTFSGRIGELELAAVSVENSVISGLAFGVMLGMGSALETLCGQAYGAGQLRMLGIYMQRSWVILFTTALCLLPVYIWAPPILSFFGEAPHISKAAGKFALWMIPQLFAYSANFPIQKFLQSQGKVLVMAWISGLLYILITKSDGAWSGFSWLAFRDLYGFVKLSLASAVMLCLEFWYLMILVVVTGLLPNPLIPVDAISICMNIEGWTAMISIGFNAAISVRVSNELGAGNAYLAKFAVIVVSITSTLIGEAVAAETTRIAVLLAFTVLLNSLQPVLSGVAVGAGWQSLVAYVNLACYYIIGLPAGLVLGFTLNLGVQGIWGGMVAGICLQTLILIGIIYYTNWNKEAEQAESRVQRWGGTARE